MLFADVPTPHAEVSDHLVRVFGLGRVTAALFVLTLTAFGSLLALSLWSRLVWAWDRLRYGGWVVRVRGGRTGRAWHVPLDLATAKALGTGNYAAFKRDLGTLLSGEGNVDFSFGVPLDQPCRPAVPQAPGLSIDFEKREIAMEYAAGRSSP